MARVSLVNTQTGGAQGVFPTQGYPVLCSGAGGGLGQGINASEEGEVVWLWLCPGWRGGEWQGRFRAGCCAPSKPCESSALLWAAGSSSSPELGAPWEAVVLCPSWPRYRNPAMGWMFEKPGENSSTCSIPASSWALPRAGANLQAGTKPPGLRGFWGAPAAGQHLLLLVRWGNQGVRREGSYVHTGNVNALCATIRGQDRASRCWVLTSPRICRGCGTGMWLGCPPAPILGKSPKRQHRPLRPREQLWGHLPIPVG